jgi:ABC-2 type transport system permease protein
MIHIAIKEIIIFLHDPKAVLLSFLLPIALITLFALAFGGVGKSDSEQKPIRILVADLDSTEVSRDIIAQLDTLPEIILLPSPLDQAKDAVMNGDRLAVLVFHKGLADSIASGGSEPIEILYDQARRMESGLIQYALISNLMSVLGPKTMKNKIIKSVKSRYTDIDPMIMETIEEEIALQFEDSGEDETSGGANMMEMAGSIEVTALSRKRTVNWSLIQSFAGTAVMMLLFSVAAMGSSILSEREHGTLKRLLYSPINPIHIMFGKMIFAILFGSAQLFIMLLFTWIVLGLDPGSGVWYLLLVIPATAFACAAFGMFIASISRSRAQSESLSTIVILVMSAIGGSMIPIFFMPQFMQQMAVISLNYWAIQSFFDVLGRDAGLMQILTKTGMLLLIGIVMTTISVFLFKRNVVKVT